MKAYSRSLAKPSTWLSTAIIGFTAASAAPPSGVEVSQTQIISADNPDVPHGEGWLAGNPVDPANRIVTSMAFPGDARWASVIYYSKDRGRTWARATHGQRREAYFLGDDPTLAFGVHGTAFYADLEWGSGGTVAADYARASAAESLATYLYRSDDGGATWGAPVILSGTDHPVLAVDSSDRKYRGRLYVATTVETASMQGDAGDAISFSYSDDDARTFKQRILSPGAHVSGGDGAQSIEPDPADMLVTPEGVVVLAYTTRIVPANDSRPGESAEVRQLWVVSSRNGGRTFSAPLLAAMSSFPGGAGSAQRFMRTVSFPRLAIDTSAGPNRGRLYLAYRDFIEPWIRIKVISSADGGRIWTPSITVESESVSGDQSAQELVVNRDGIVGVSWADRRGDVKNECYREYFAASIDGAETFLPGTTTSDGPTCPRLRGNWRINGDEFSLNDRGGYGLGLATPAHNVLNGGETQGLLSLDDGSFQLTWPAGNSGVLQLASTQFRVSTPPLGEDVGDVLKLSMYKPTLDTVNRTMRIQVTATNLSQRPLAAPLTLVATSVASNLGALHEEHLRAQNSDNGLQGRGAAWRLGAGTAEATSLEPGTETQQVTLTFSYEDAEHPPASPDLELDFHVYERHR